LLTQNVAKMTVNELYKVMKSKGYKCFDNKVNIVGVRNRNLISNSFDDKIIVVDINKRLFEYPATTDPGKYWLNNPINVRGTAILVPGQYIDAFKLGMHRNRYKALVQHRAVEVWRDNNRDNILDTGGRKYTGIFGINIHRSNPVSRSILVDKWSAGCQVFKSAADFKEFISICERSEQQEFTYTLLDESDFNTTT